MAKYLTGRERLAHAASLGRWLMDRRPADARAIADGAGAVLAERNALADQVQRVRALDLHQASVHQPDECVRDCPGCAIDRALDAGPDVEEA